MGKKKKPLHERHAEEADLNRGLFTPAAAGLAPEGDFNPGDTVYLRSGARP
jgi:hypothetical protein